MPTPTLQRRSLLAATLAAPFVARAQEQIAGGRPITFVLDHLAGMTPTHRDDAQAWSALDTPR